MAISCAYCGGAHERVDEVRACWQRSQRRPVAAHVTAGVTAGVTTGVGPGPAALGRHVVVLPGQDAPVAWEGAERIVVDHRALQAPDQVLPRLRRAAVARERLVLEVHPGVENPPASVEHRPPYELGPRFSFLLDELHHLVWSNAVDARSGRNSWWLVEAAVAAGARAGGPADVVLPSGEPAWLDGGPLRFSERLDGAGVLSAVAVEHGSLVPFGHNTPGADLAPDQLAAVTHPGGAARIIAPAGSGKTRVLTERARHLRQAWNLPSGAVSLVAFNRRAQQEMAVRTTDIERLQVRTLNAIALAIVNGSRPFAPRSMTRRTIEEVDVRRMLGRLVEVPARRNQDPFAPWIEALGMIRLGLLPPEIVEERYDGDVAGLTAVWPRDREMLDREELVDFDHQVYLALEVLLTDPEARRVAQRACRVLLVDEFQDLTPAHVLLVRLLAGPQGHVFGVGDDDQTIYGYNGADPAWLIDFAELFPGAGDHPLEVNYRCPADVVLGADRLLRHNRRRVPKTIRAAREGTTGLHVVPVEDTVAAAVEAVRDALARGRTPEQVAVLTRVNALLAPVQVALGAVGVPVTGGVGTNFVEQVSIRAVLAWLRLAAEPAKLRPDDLAEALRRPSRPLHPRVADWVQEQTSIAWRRSWRPVRRRPAWCAH
jgi:DNA helicase-2/ATP-dependent DNA helicase PcrA